MWWRSRSLRSSKLTKRRRRVFLFRGALTLILFITLSLGVVYLLNRKELVINQINIEGNATASDSDIGALVKNAIEGKYIFFIPKKSTFLFPKRTLEASILGAFPKIRNVSAVVGKGGILNVLVEERSPEALWCGENRLEGAMTECFFLDENGFIYAKAPSFSRDVYVRFYGPLEKGKPVGQPFLSGEKFRKLFLFLTSLRESNIQPVEFAVRDDLDYELYIENGTKILFSRKQNLSTVLDNLVSAFSFEGIRKNERASLEYVDLRFGNRVYYKFKE